MAEPGRADLNLYAYVSNRPLVASDPTGLEGEVDVPQTDRQKIEASLRASGVDVGGPPPIVDDAVALQMLQSGVAKPESEITIGNETFLPEMTITGDAELAGRAKAAGNSVELQEFLEHTPGVIQKQDVTGFLKGLVNSPAATVEGASNLVGLDLQLSEFKLSLNPNEGSGSLIGEGLGPGPLAVAGATAKGLGRLGMALELTPNLPLSVAAAGTVDLYRAVGVREFESVTSTGKFLPGANSLEGRQFAYTMEEALKYADTDLSKVAVLKASVRGDAISAFDFSKAIDPHIFSNGVITVQPGPQSELFHQMLIGIDHVF